MNKDFHYYATYSAAVLAGYTHEESLTICAAALMPDLCTRSFLSGIHGPLSAATTQSQMELADMGTDPVSLQDITRIWASFHFLPYNLYAQKKKRCGKRYLNKYRLICGPNGDLLVETVKLAKGKGLEAAGLAMHVLADTWAHRYFAGTPSLVINNTNYYFYELVPGKNRVKERPVTFTHNPMKPDDLKKSAYTNSLFQSSENSIMNLGHGRAGHLPDYGFIRYKYLPAWGDFQEIVKDNPADYRHAFAQMVYALKFLRGTVDTFEKKTYAWETVAPCRDDVTAILSKRQLDASDDWRALGEKLSGREVPDIDLDAKKTEYLSAGKEEKSETFLGRFILAALSQKSMVTNRIYKSGNKLAGYSIEYKGKGYLGIRDFRQIIEQRQKEERA